MTIDEIRESNKSMLIPSDIAEVLGVTSYSITTQVRNDKRDGINSFCFPTIRIGTRTYIPRIPFLRAMGVDL